MNLLFYISIDFQTSNKAINYLFLNWIINYLLTNSEDFTGKSQMEALPY